MQTGAASATVALRGRSFRTSDCIAFEPALAADRGPRTADRGPRTADCGPSTRVGVGAGDKVDFREACGVQTSAATASAALRGRSFRTSECSLLARGGSASLRGAPMRRAECRIGVRGAPNGVHGRCGSQMQRKMPSATRCGRRNRIRTTARRPERAFRCSTGAVRAAASAALGWRFGLRKRSLRTRLLRMLQLHE